MPNDVWLSGVTFTQSTDGKTAGTVSFSVTGTSHDSVARWVRQVSTLPALAGLWVPSEAKAVSSGPNPTSTVSFASTATLTSAAKSNRADNVVGSNS